MLATREGQEGEEGAGPTPFFDTLNIFGWLNCPVLSYILVAPFKINTTYTVPSGSIFDINSISYLMLNSYHRIFRISLQIYFLYCYG